MKKKIFIGLLAILILMQFIRPAKNVSAAVQTNDIASKYVVPDEVGVLLKTACYDCHSNNTIYPWYANLQPIAWWLNDHIVEGKSELNFSEFGAYSAKKQAHKLDEVVELTNNGEMPLSSYTLIHGNAKLNDLQKKKIVDWANELKMQINQTSK